MPEATLPTLMTAAGWESVVTEGHGELAAALAAYLPPRRWFGAKLRTIRSVTIDDHVRLPYGAAAAYLALLRVEYADGGAERYLLPLACASAGRAAQLLRDAPQALIAWIDSPGASALIDATSEPAFASSLLERINAGDSLPSAHGGRLLATPTAALAGLIAASDTLAPALLGGEQSNSSIRFGQHLIMKLYRKVEPGLNPDLELGRYLTEERGFAGTPPLAGGIEYRRGADEPITVGLLQGFVPNQGNARAHALRLLAGYFDALAATPEAVAPPTEFSVAALLEASDRRPGTKDQGPRTDDLAFGESPSPLAPGQADNERPASSDRLFGPALELAELLGRRTAELHRELAAGTAPDLAPEPLTGADLAAIADGIAALSARTFAGLRALLPGLPAEVRGEAERAAAKEPALLARVRAITGAGIGALRTRTHGDYHLEQVLFTGADYLIIDFEGEPVLPMRERRTKRSPLRDVAGMLRSYQYAAYGALFSRPADPGSAARLRGWADYWTFWVSAAFLRGYLRASAGAAYLPPDRRDLAALLEVFVIEKVIYEITYEMNNRPSWLIIPLSGMPG